jgi:hypothetical protein
MEGRKGETPKKLQVYNTEERLLFDGELTRRSVDFMKRHSLGYRPPAPESLLPKEELPNQLKAA